MSTAKQRKVFETIGRLQFVDLDGNNEPKIRDNDVNEFSNAVNAKKSKEFEKGIAEWILEFCEGLMKFNTQCYELIKNSLLNVWDAAKEFFAEMFNLFKNLCKKFWNFIKDSLRIRAEECYLAMAAQLAKSCFQWIVRKFGRDTARTMVKVTGNFFKAFGEQMTEMGKNFDFSSTMDKAPEWLGKITNPAL